MNYITSWKEEGESMLALRGSILSAASRFFLPKHKLNHNTEIPSYLWVHIPRPLVVAKTTHSTEPYMDLYLFSLCAFHTALEFLPLSKFSALVSALNHYNWGQYPVG